MAFCKHNKEYCDSLFGGVSRDKILANKRFLLDENQSSRRNEAIKRSLLDNFWSRDKMVTNKRFALVEKVYNYKTREAPRRIRRKNSFFG